MYPPASPYDLDDFHTSPSDFNLFIEESALWFIKHYFGYRTEVGPAAHRGSAVETALTSYLFHGGLPVDLATDQFRLLTGGEISDEVDSELENLEPMLKQAIKAFKGISLIQTQRKVETVIAGINVVGYLDFLTEDCLIDLKTTKAVPTKPRAGHLRQIAFYSHVVGVPARLCYVSGKKFSWFDISADDAATAMRQVTATCRAISRVRRLDWRYAADLYPPRDLSSFYWDDASKYLAQEIWQT